MVSRSRTQEKKSNISVPCLAAGVDETQPREHVLMCVAPVATEGSAETCCLGWHLWPGRCPRAMLPGPMVASRPWLLPRHIWVHAPAIARDCVDILDPHCQQRHTYAQDLGHNLGPCYCRRAMLTPDPSQFEWVSPGAMVSSGSELLPRVM